MAKCSFCEKVIPRGTGKMYVQNDGKIYYFCGNKCEKNLVVLGRKGRETKWVTKKQTPKGSKKSEGQ